MYSFIRGIAVSTLVVMVAVQSCFGISPEDIKALKAQVIQKHSIIGDKHPEYTVDGVWQMQDEPNWFSGFLGGQYWIMYQLTGGSQFKNWGVDRADLLLPYSDLSNTHDMGFIFLPTVVAAYEETGSAKYREGALEAAEMLKKRFNEKGEYIRAWGELGTPDNAGLMIVDTMMNLELLFWAAEETGNREYYEVALTHALTTRREHIREDGSSFHVVKFDPSTGMVMDKITHQGYSDTSTWARGQAWGIYGFANTYKYTGDKRFLRTSQAMADYFVTHLPPDSVPHWDLDLSGDDIIRDASAGAIAASGLYLLSDVAEDNRKASGYAEYADAITTSLAENYMFTESARETEQGLLIHAVYHYNNDWGVDESNPAGDYYFLQAIQKKLNREQ